MSYGISVQGVSVFKGGSVQGIYMSRGKCPGGTCPGGLCPRTLPDMT